MSTSLTIILVEKSGTLKASTIKDFKEEDLYKKCGFKKAEGFAKQNEWVVKIEGKVYFISVYAKDEGKANGENKYDFPPPIDNKLFFGTCAIVSSIKNEDGSKKWCDFSIPLWDKIYEKLFGGFEDLNTTMIEDEEEEDELKNVPAEKKTKQGYLKDGFVVDSDSNEDGSDYNSGEESEEENDDDDEEENEDDDDDENLILEDIGSELSEEEYDYNEDDDKSN